ncbi:MAG: chorismate mutase [Alphaproteobacteria bacterium]|nr:chorismate mutase [Alphaproteobacteria bacterium]
MAHDPILQQRRAEIDAIDVQLLALLTERIGIVRKVGVHKRSQDPDQCFLRPGREADMVRDIAAKGAGHFPPEALAAMWRMLISGSLSIEQPFSVSAYSTPGNPDCYWLAREYFGGFVPIREHGDAASVIADLRDRRCFVGALPVPTTDTWWTRLLEKDSAHLKVFGIAPFVVPRSRPDAATWLVGPIAPEATSDDTSIIAMAAPAPAGWRRLGESAVNGISLYAAPGFMTEVDIPASARLLGAYANPVTLEP